jgi:hypothetical protein
MASWSLSPCSGEAWEILLLADLERRVQGGRRQVLRGPSRKPISHFNILEHIPQEAVAGFFKDIIDDKLALKTQPETYKATHHLELYILGGQA